MMLWIGAVVRHSIAFYETIVRIATLLEDTSMPDTAGLPARNKLSNRVVTEKALLPSESTAANDNR